MKTVNDMLEAMAKNRFESDGLIKWVDCPQYIKDIYVSKSASDAIAMLENWPKYGVVAHLLEELKGMK